MIETLRNDRYNVKIRINGAELISWIDLEDGIEHIWQADPAFWPWHAPMLFPIIGVTENDLLRIDGEKYPMPKHGFARRSEFLVAESTADKLVFVLKSSEKTLSVYPYEFELKVTYQLSDNALLNTYEVQNTGRNTMYFHIGAHPALTLCWGKNEKLDDYVIRFEQKETLSRHHINASGMFDGRASQVLNDNDLLPLHGHLFDEDALIFKDHKSRKVYIESSLHRKKVEISFSDFPYLGIWSMPGAPYVCIEPWQGCADTAGRECTLQEKEQIVCLSAGTRRSWSFRMAIL